LWHTIGLPLLGLMYVRAKDVVKIPAKYQWKFRTKLELAVEQMLAFAALAKSAKKTVWAVVDGAYAKRPFLKPLRAAGVVVVSRLRKDAALFDLPSQSPQRGRGRPRKYGAKRMRLAPRAAHRLGWETVECFVYGQWVKKTFKTFLATYRPADGMIHVVIVKEEHGCQFFFCTDPQVAPQAIIEAFADRASIEQDFHDSSKCATFGQTSPRST
jgi:hypothetical protein